VVGGPFPRWGVGGEWGVQWNKGGSGGGKELCKKGGVGVEMTGKKGRSFEDKAY